MDSIAGNSCLPKVRDLSLSENTDVSGQLKREREARFIDGEAKSKFVRVVAVHTGEGEIHKDSTSVPSEKDLTWRMVCAGIPEKYIGLAFCAWFGEKELKRQYFTNVVNAATFNPDLKFLCFYDDRHKSASSIKRLFSEKDGLPENIQPVSVTSFLTSNPVSQINDEDQKQFANEDLTEMHKKMNSGRYARTKDELFNYISRWSASEVFPEKSDCKESSGLVFRLYFDMDAMIAKRISTHVVEIFNPENQKFDYDTSICGTWGEQEPVGNFSIVVQVDSWKKADGCNSVQYHTIPDAEKSYYLDTQVNDLTFIKGFKIFHIGECLTDEEYTCYMQKLFDNPNRGNDVIASCTFIYDKKLKTQSSENSSQPVYIDSLKKSISLNDLLAIDKAIAFESGQLLTESLQEELIRLCVNTSNVKILEHLFITHKIGNTDTLTRCLPVAINDHNTDMSDCLLRLGARLDTAFLNKALKDAVSKLNIKIADYLLNLNQGGKLEPDDLNEALVCAINAWNIKAADWLNQHGAEITSDELSKALYQSIFGCKSVEVWDWLVDHGAEIGSNLLNDSLFFYILNNRTIEQLNWLVAHGAKPDELSKEDKDKIRHMDEHNYLKEWVREWLSEKLPTVIHSPTDS